MTDRALFGWILLAGLIGSLIGVPWSLAILEDAATVWLSVAVEVVLFLAPAVAAGVWWGKKAGLGLRSGRPVSGAPGHRGRLGRDAVPAVLVGSILGGVGYLAQGALPEGAFTPALEIPRTFERFLRCVSAALTEEIFFRFGLMTFFVLALRSLVERPAMVTPSLWIGNLLSSLAFAAAHLPQLTTYGGSLLVPFVTFSVGAGMVMGWVYMRYGLIPAVITHFMTDLVVHVIPRWVASLR